MAPMPTAIARAKPHQIRFIGVVVALASASDARVKGGHYRAKKRIVRSTGVKALGRDRFLKRCCFIVVNDNGFPIDRQRGDHLTIL
jgi:hypothetical protein